MQLSITNTPFKQMLLRIKGKHSKIFFLALCFFALASCSKGNDSKTGLPPKDTVSNNTTIPEEPFPELSRFKIPMQDFIGVNGFHEDDVELTKAAGVLRAYCNWDWFQGDNPGDQLIFQNSRGGWYFDDAFRKIKNAGIKTAMCFQGAIKNLHGTTNFKYDDKPIDAPGMSTTNPESYTQIANTLYQIAARYGKTKVAPEKLNVPAGQKVSGLDLLEYIEVWNEPDKDWEGPNAYFSPQEYAAMLSKCYDKIKEADPNMKVVMGGLATLSVQYVKEMKAWFEANRADKKFAADVVNMHIYAFNNKIIWGQTWPLFGPAETPEDARLKEKSAEIVKYCLQNVPHAEVWISEFGWDTYTESALCPKRIANLSVNEVQARWIVRGYLGFAAAGVDRAQLFVLYDPGQNTDGTSFATSGLIDRSLNFSKKTSWYYVRSMKEILKDMNFFGEQASNNPDIVIYKFIDSSKKGVYAVWCKTSANKTIENYKLPVSKHATHAEKTELLDKNETGEKSSLEITGNSVTITVSEKPVFITVNNIL